MKASKFPLQATVRVPASTSNLGPGFDTLGVALKLYNTTRVRRESAPKPTGMIAETAAAFFKCAAVKPFSFSAEIAGDVPRGRGFGSSDTVRIGVAAGLNVLAGRPLDEAELLGLMVELEGHPDNAVPSFYGGFIVASAERFFRTTVGPELEFVCLVPEFELSTTKMRALLPAKIARRDVVSNLQHAALIAAAFVSRDYAQLAGLFVDRIHQPYRGRLIPCWEPVREAAVRAGALDCFISGSGPTLIALSLGDGEAVGRRMLAAAKKAGVTARMLVTTADNTGVVVR